MSSVAGSYRVFPAAAGAGRDISPVRHTTHRSPPARRHRPSLRPKPRPRGISVRRPARGPRRLSRAPASQRRGMVKIVTYNVNGLRPRVAQHGSLRCLLDALDADIICFQETKLSRQDLSGDVIVAEGYEAFISCNRTTRGHGTYSGVATFCQGSAKDSEMLGDFVLEMPVEEEALGEITREELLRMDNEGRCVITDHGHFETMGISIGSWEDSFHCWRFEYCSCFYR